MTITIDLLRAKEACLPQIALFAELFPNGAPMTVEAAVSVADRFNWDWAAENLLTGSFREAYDEAVAAARKAYAEARAPAFATAYIAQMQAEEGANE